MDQRVKNFFLVFIKANKKGLILALLFFVFWGLIFSPRLAWAQIPGLNCALWDIPCLTANFFLSIMIKIVVLIFFGIPLLISAIFVGIMALILGWIISPDFISLKFTQNPFVNIGLSITRGFANMGFILFLVVIALATVLRIEEYKAKKTLITLILVALLINFSPVFCGFIIDASNIVMNFFLSGITGLTGFSNFLYNAALSIWNSLITSGFDVWANIAAAMQVVISIVFNFFAGYIFILFSANFIMRYIMLWILVILSPIAFVSYILPITRKGRTLLNWRTWWEQLISWSIIGIIAGFFLYLGFTMISMINANPGAVVTQPDLSFGGGGLGLMNNILPYLIPLVLLWIAHKEKKRTSAWFAREIMEMPEKVAKSAVMAAAIAATAGTGAAAAGALKGLPAAMGKFGKKVEEFGTKHRVLGAPARLVTRPARWAQRGYEKRIKPAVAEKIVTPLEERVVAPAKRGVKWFEAKFPGFTKYVKAAGEGLRERSREFLLGYRKEKGRALTPEELQDKHLKKEGRALTPSEERSGYLEEVREKRVRKDLKPGEIKTDKKGNKYILEHGRKRQLTSEEVNQGYTEDIIKEVKRGRELRPEEKAKKRVIENVRELTVEEITKQHIIIKRVTKPIIIKGVTKVERPGLVHIVQEGIRKGVREFIKARAAITPLEKERRRAKLRELRERFEKDEEPKTEEEWREYEEMLEEVKERRERGEEITGRSISELIEKEEKEEK